MDKHTKRSTQSSSGYADEHTAFVDDIVPEHAAHVAAPDQGEHAAVNQTPVPRGALPPAPQPKPQPKKRHKGRPMRISGKGRRP